MAMNGHHGNTWANWAGVVVGLLGVCLASYAILISPVSWVLFWIGLALLPVAALVVSVLGKTGLGVKDH